MQDRFGLYIILTNPRAGYAACAEAAVSEEVRYLQLRIKNRPRSEILDTARELRAITRGTGTRFIINDDLTIAMESDADGLHVGQDDESLSRARATWNQPGKLFGLSTHCHEQVSDAQAERPDYIGIGPVFSTPSKPDSAPPLGIKQTAEILKGAPMTAVAIGGINSGNLAKVLEAGIPNFCVIRAVNDAVDPVAAIRHLQDIYRAHRF